MEPVGLQYNTIAFVQRLNIEKESYRATLVTLMLSISREIGQRQTEMDVICRSSSVVQWRVRQRTTNGLVTSVHSISLKSLFPEEGSEGFCASCQYLMRPLTTSQCSFFIIMSGVIPTELQSHITIPDRHKIVYFLTKALKFFKIILF